MSERILMICSESQKVTGMITLKILMLFLLDCKKAGLRINANKSFFGKNELEYLGYWITCEGIQPITKKVEAIQRIATPTTKKELHSYIGMINFYRDMWPKRSELLASLAKLTSSTAKWN